VSIIEARRFVFEGGIERKLGIQNELWTWWRYFQCQEMLSKQLEKFGIFRKAIRGK
jgi:hypothetical protein